jgi:hypothetical protein
MKNTTPILRWDQAPWNDWLDFRRCGWGYVGIEPGYIRIQARSPPVRVFRRS